VATDREAMLRALEGLVQSESPSLDKTRCDGCANRVADLFQQMVGGRLHRLPL